MQTEGFCARSWRMVERRFIEQAGGTPDAPSGLDEDEARPMRSKFAMNRHLSLESWQ